VWLSLSFGASTGTFAASKWPAQYAQATRELAGSARTDKEEDQRVTEELYVQMLSRPVDVLVLGSSTVRSIEADKTRERPLSHVAQWERHGVGLWIVSDARGFVGYAGLDRIEHAGRPEMDLICALLPSAWGQGYGVEALRSVTNIGFSEIGLESILVRIFAESEPSLQTAERLGFRYEGYATPRLVYRRRPVPPSLGEGFSDHVLREAVDADAESIRALARAAEPSALADPDPRGFRLRGGRFDIACRGTDVVASVGLWPTDRDAAEIRLRSVAGDADRDRVQKQSQQHRDAERALDGDAREHKGDRSAEEQPAMLRPHLGVEVAAEHGQPDVRRVDGHHRGEHQDDAGRRQLAGEVEAEDERADEHRAAEEKEVPWAREHGSMRTLRWTVVDMRGYSECRESTNARFVPSARSWDRVAYASAPRRPSARPAAVRLALTKSACAVAWCKT
jgi:RimJ/RimL family protein N-acetyltransferase